MSALALALLVAAAPGAAKLPFIHDDYPKALAEAQARQVPIVADVWTPW